MDIYLCKGEDTLKVLVGTRGGDIIELSIDYDSND